MNATKPSRRRPDRRRAPRLPPGGPRKMELIGLTQDGRMVLWDTGMVRPISAFETSRSGDPFIQDGHYVIDWKGHAITVHCGNELRDGRWVIGVLFMCSGAHSVPMAREDVEAMLIGQVVRDPVEEARTRELLREAARRIAKAQDTPERQRGRIA